MRRVEAWLDVGSAVDAVLGEQTRPHADLDLIVRVDQLAALRQVLWRDGIAEVPGGMDIARWLRSGPREARADRQRRIVILRRPGRRRLVERENLDLRGWIRIHSVIEYAQAPIAPGSQRCVRLSDGGRIEREDGMAFDSNDVSFLVDLQLEHSGRHPVLRHVGDGRALGFDLERHSTGITAHVWLGVESDWSYGRTSLSGTTGKRLAIRLLTKTRVALIDEIQPWGPPTAERIALAPGVGLAATWKGLRVGGASGEFQGESYRGRIAEVTAIDRLMRADEIERLRVASSPNDRADVPIFNPGALNDEGRELFLADYGQLVRWHNQGSLNHRELRDASSLAHVWFLDRYPLLQRVSDHYGAMLSFPDLRRSQTLAKRIEEDKPALWAPQSEHAGDWVPLSTFRDDLACWLGQRDHVVTWGAFIKFVRNKLGGGHFDPEERQRWQHELNTLARETKVGGEPWLAAIMLTLVRSLVLAADGSGLTALARDGP